MAPSRPSQSSCEQSSTTATSAFLRHADGPRAAADLWVHGRVFEDFAATLFAIETPDLLRSAHPACAAYSSNISLNSRIARSSPSSVKTTDFTLPTGSPIIP